MNEDYASETTERTERLVGYVPLREGTPALYARLGFRCGLEIHQQLKTEKKLFCRCPAGLYQEEGEYDAQLVRHMRPTLSELGEYDGTALMEFKTKKNIIYRIKGETACTYDIDDTPPFPLNREALRIAIEIALLLRTSIVGELHITRKQYLDGSIPTGFQRTAIVGIDGEIPLANKTVRIRQLSIEEDSCREVSDVGHERVYTTDRLGIPLVETVTEPDLLTPHEAAEAADYIRYLARSTGKVRVGIGAARQDVNVSIAGGTRVEIKGVQHIRWIPRLTHNEAFRQKALLLIRDELLSRIGDPPDWSIGRVELPPEDLLPGLAQPGHRAVALNLPGFAGILPFFTSPGRTFADEISDRVKVIACIEKPNMTSSEEGLLPQDRWDETRSLLHTGGGDAQIIIWGPADDIETAVEAVDERCRLAFVGVPNETRKALPDGTTVFERVLPGPDRMYPDTDSAPIPIDEDTIAAAAANLPKPVVEQMRRLAGWRIPPDTHRYILRRNLFPLLRLSIEEAGLPPVFAGTLLGHTVRSVLGDGEVDTARLGWLIEGVMSRRLEIGILRELVPLSLADREADLDGLLKRVGYRACSEDEIRDRLREIREELREGVSRDKGISEFVIGLLRPIALGNIPLRELARIVREELQ